MRFHLRLVAGLGLALAASCAARAADPQKPSLTSAEPNVAYAVSAICAPFVLDDIAESALPTSQPLVRSDGWSEPIFQQLGAKPIRVGFAGFVHVGVGVKGTQRQCEMTAKHADPQALRHAVLDALALRPEHFAPTKSRYLPGHFASEDMLCAAADSPHPSAFVMLSSPAPEEKDRIAILFTHMDARSRMPSCDQAGVKMNFRALAP